MWYSFIFKFFKRKKIEVKELPQAETIIETPAETPNLEALDIFHSSFQEIHDKLDSENAQKKIALLNDIKRLNTLFKKLWSAAYSKYNDRASAGDSFILISPSDIGVNGIEFETFRQIFTDISQHMNLVDVEDSRYFCLHRDKYEQMLQQHRSKYQNEIDEKMRELLRQGIYR